MQKSITYLNEAETRAWLECNENDNLAHWERPISKWFIDLWRGFKLNGTSHGIEGCSNLIIQQFGIDKEHYSRVVTMLFDASNESRRLYPLECGFQLMNKEILEQALNEGKKLEIYQGDSIFPREENDPKRFARAVRLPDGRMAMMAGKQRTKGWIAGECYSPPHVKIRN